MPAISTPTAETCSRIRLAAELWAEGMSWDAISHKFVPPYANAESCRTTLCNEHPEIWEAEKEAASKTQRAQSAVEARLTQRQLLRPWREVTRPDGTKQIQEIPIQTNQSAAHSLLSIDARDRAAKLEVSDPSGSPILLGVVLDASRVDNGRPNESPNGNTTEAP